MNSKEAYIEKLVQDKYEEDINYTFQFNRCFLRPIGVWPMTQGASIIVKLLNNFLIIMSYWLICFLMIPCCLHTLLEVQDNAIKLKLIGPISFALMAFTKYGSLLNHSKDLQKCIEHVEADWKNLKTSVDRETMRRNAKTGRYLAILCCVFMYGGGIFFHGILPLTSPNIITSINTTIRPLAYPVYSAFFNPQKSPNYEIIFMIQCFSAFVVDSVTIGACSISGVFVMHACGQFEIIMVLLENLVDGDGSDTVKDRISIIVQRHLRVLSLLSRLDEMLQGVCFVEFVGCTLNMCFLGYYLITEWENSETIGTLTYAILLVSLSFNIFIFCYIGDILMTQCSKIGRASYMINWYNLPGKSALDLILLITVSNSPSKITAGKFVDLSLTTFCSVAKTAMAYFNLLRTVM